MKNVTGWSIRTYLFLLVILSVIPALVIIIHTGLEQKRSALNDVHNSCMAFISAISTDLDTTMTGTRQMLATLSILPEVRKRDPAACDRLLVDILRNNPRYISLHISHPDGDNFASALPLKGRVNVKDRKYFRDAVATRSFSAGEYVLGKQSQNPMFNFAYPVMEANGDLLAVIEAGIDLANFACQISKANLPPEATLSIIDRNGIILHDSGNRKSLLGSSDVPVLFADMKASKDQDKVVTRTLDERRYIVVYHSLRLQAAGEPYMYVRLQVPEDVALADVHHLVARNLGLMFVFALLAGLAAFLFAHFSIISRTRKLVVASEQLAAGNEDVRVGISHDDGEFGLIARAFDKMSETLALRDAERIRFVEELDNAVTWAIDEKRKNEAIIAGIGDGLSIQDRDFRILFQNDVHQKLIGNHVGSLCHEAYENSPHACTPCPVRECFEDGRIHTTERSAQAGNTLIHLLITASPLRDSSGEIVGGIELVKDITERKELEMEREEMSRKLAESNRELQHFAYIASHDLQEPLRTITSFIQLLAKRYQGKLDKDADDFIGFVTDGAQRMQQLISDLLAYSRVESKGKAFAPFEGEVALGHALANLRLTTEESGAVITHAPLPAMSGDETQIVQLFQNLIANAIKFRGSEPPLIHIDIMDKGTEWAISVRDNGIGIDPKFFDRIFELFQRLHTRDHYTGTGIGLSVCKKIVERHGGRIGVASEPGRGATFTFTIRKGLQTPV
jgi:signal transduction histidine kinase/HAMP domain-containing protein